MTRSRTAARIVVGIAAIALIAVFLWLQSCSRERSANTRANLGESQTGAAIESGRDAVNTVGKAQTREAQTDAITRENDDAIRNADGADAPVAAGVRDAGLASLCKRASYSGSARCVQYANPN